MRTQAKGKPLARVFGRVCFLSRLPLVARMALVPVALFPVALLAADGGSTVVLEGRILDAEASTQAFHSGMNQGEQWFVPIADRVIEVAWRAGGGSWTATTDAEGRFRIDTGRASLPPEALFVAQVEERGEMLYSPSISFSSSGGSSTDVFVYPTTDREDRVSCELQVAHDIVGEGEEARLRVRLRLNLDNFDPALYVGEKRGSRWREVFKVAAPRDAEVVVNHGPVPGLRWKRSEDGRWFVIDEPVAGFPDLAVSLRSSRERGRGRPSWDLTYVYPARQTSGFTFRFPVRCERFLVFAEKDRMEVASPTDLSPPMAMPRDPFTRESRSFDAYGLRGGSSASVEAGDMIVYVLGVDNAAIGEVSERAVKWHGGFVVVSLVAILLGFLLAPRRAPAEVLGGLGQAEVLDRIAALDKRFEQGKVPEREYRRYREALVEIAAEELQAGERGGTAQGETAAGAAGGPAQSPAVAGLLGRLRELDRGTESPSPEMIQERAHLLEALYKRLDEESSR